MPFKTTLPKILQNGKLYNLSDLLGQTMVANEDTPLYKFPTTEKNIYAIEDFTKLSGVAKIYAAQDGTSIYYSDKPNAPAAKGIKAGAELGTFKSLKSGGGAYFTRKNDAHLYYINSIDNSNWYLSGSAYKQVPNLVATIKKGQPIGELWTYARGIKQSYDATTKRYTSKLTDEFYLVFKYNGKAVYSKVTPNLIDTKTLAQQDIKTTEEQSQTTGEKFEKYFKIILIGGAVILVAVPTIKALIYSKVSNRVPMMP